MTNEELRKKICDIIAPYVSAYGDDERIADALIANKFGRIINFAEYVGSKIAGHSNYRGDSILCALYCAAEGKEIHTVKPLDITEYGYNVLVKERDEWKHRALIAESAVKNIMERAGCNICDNLNCPYYEGLNSGYDIEYCTHWWLEQAEKELAEEEKDD